MREHMKSGNRFYRSNGFFFLFSLSYHFDVRFCTGLTVAQYLETHPCVERVIHPGLPSHPQHELFKRQCYGHSGMVTMYIKGGLDEAKAFFKSLKVFTLAESLGGYESLAELPALMTHASVSPEERAVLGISDNLIRLSVGLEDVSDIIADLDNALRAAVN